MSSPADQYRQSFVELSAVQMTNSSGSTTVKIDDLVRSIHIYEDLFFHGITGYLEVTDSANLIDGLPIRGDETLQLTFITPDIPSAKKANGGFDKTFKVYKVSDTTPSENLRHYTYKIHFCSPHIILDMASKLSMAIGSEAHPMKVSDAVTKICNKTLNIQNLTAIATANTKYFIIPNLNPIQTINWLSYQCQPDPAIGLKDSSSTYIFYENRFGVSFVPLGALLEGKDPTNYPDLLTDINPLSHAVAAPVVNQSSDTRLNAPMAANEFKWTVMFDRFENSNAGAFGSTYLYHDYINKQLKTQVYDYQRDGADIVPVDSTNAALIVTADHTSSPFERTSLLPLNTTAAFNPYQDSYSVANPWKNKHRSRIQLLENYVIEASIPGDSRLLLGQLINFNLSSLYAASQPKLMGKEGGKYLVSKIHHHIEVSTKKYFQHIEMVKGSLTKA